MEAYLAGDGRDADLSKPPIDEASLRALGKNVGALFLTQSSELRSILADKRVAVDLSSKENQLRGLNHLLEVLLVTANTTGISEGHRAAAYNALSAFIDRCRVSADDGVKGLVASEKLSLALLDIYLSRYERGKSKPIKQLIGCLISLLATDQLISWNPRLRQQAVEYLIKAIGNLDADQVRAKAAFQALSVFVSRNAIDLNSLVHIYFEITKSGTGDWDLEHREQRQVSRFIYCILEWVSVPNVASSIANFLRIFLSRLSQETSKSQDLIWVQPLQDSLSRNSEFLESYRTQVFPELFTLNPASTWCFLNGLGILDLQHGQKRVQNRISEVGTSRLRENSAILHAALRVCKELGLVQEVDQSVDWGIRFEGNTVRISDRILGEMLFWESSVTQLSGLSLLISSTHATRPFTASTLKYLRKALPYMHASSDPHVRGEIFSLEKRLIDRMRAATAAMARSINLQHIEKTQRATTENDQAKLTLEDRLLDHKTFLEGLLEDCVFDLHPNASYQRHISALNLFSVFVTSGLDPSIHNNKVPKSSFMDIRWPFTIPVMTGNVCRLLADLLLDPYDDVRQNSLDVLKLSRVALKTHSIKFAANDALISERALGRAKHIMFSTGRVDVADGVARMYDIIATLSLSATQYPQSDPCESYYRLMDNLMDETESSVRIGQKDIFLAATTKPLHGLLTALRYVIAEGTIHISKIHGLREYFTKLYPRIAALTSSVWFLSRNILCDDAPEGFLPHELEDDTGMATKDILSYAWRALKESSLLARDLASSLLSRIFEGIDFLDKLSEIGQLSFEELAELRHRGAFSTAAQTFAVICSKLAEQATDGAVVVEQWYQMTIHTVKLKGSQTTRRSAGIPALMTGIIAAKASDSSFAAFVSDISAIIELKNDTDPAEPADLPQVHALNCLKSVFCSTKLASVSAHYVTPVMRMATNCLKSPSWAIRNCGLMLLRSLIDRLLGPVEILDNVVTTFYVGSRFLYGRHVGLFELLIDALSKAVNATTSSRISDDSQETLVSSSEETIFPILDFLRRAPASRSALVMVRQLSLSLTCHQSWHVREMAAQTFVSNLPVEDAAITVGDLLAHVDEDMNQIHGRILCVKHIASAARRLGHSTLAVATDILTAVVALVPETSSASITAMYLDTLWFLHSDILRSQADELDGMQTEDSSRDDAPKIAANDNSLALSKTIRAAMIRCKEIRSPSEVVGSAKLSTLHAAVDILQHTVGDCGQRSDQVSLALETYNPEDFVNALGMCEVFCFSSSAIRESFADLLSRIIDETNHEEIFSNAIALLTKLSTENYSSENSSLKIITTLAEIEAHERWIEHEIAPSTTQRLMPFLGVALRARIILWSEREDAIEACYARWIKFVKSASTDDEEFDMRLAAASSLAITTSVWDRCSIMSKTLQLSTCLSVYDALNDDDEEVREVATSAASHINDSPKMSPLFASQALCQYMLEHYMSSPKLCEEAISRLTGSGMVSDGQLMPASEALSRALIDDDALFVIEKQNLYIDEVHEAKVWAAVLKDIDIDLIDEKVAQELTRWTLSGLEALADKASHEYDGVLGWTSKREVFVVGMGVIQAAGVVLRWLSDTSEVPVQGSAIREAVLNFAQMGETQGLHPLWLTCIRKILHASELD